MWTKFDRYKISIKKKIREKQITIKRMGSKVDIKIKFQRMKLKKQRFKTKYIAIKRLRIKFDIINK